jgi:hypothetical protein
MAAPRFAPTPSAETVRTYESPEHVPESWTPTRPTDIEGRQPVGVHLGYQGPDQGYVMTLASIMRSQVRVQPGEDVEDALKGCSLIALRRASLYGRAPVIHDLTIALTIWGYLDENPPSEQVQTRQPLFEGVRNTLHHYGDGRTIADMVPEATLRMMPNEVLRQMPHAWKELTGVR